MTKRKFNNNYIPSYITKAVNYTAVAGDNIIVTADELTITLPSSPTFADNISIINGAATNISVTISSSDKIMGSDDDRIVLLGEIISKVDLFYKDSTIGWICREDYKSS